MPCAAAFNCCDGLMLGILIGFLLINVFLKWRSIFFGVDYFSKKNIQMEFSFLLNLGFEPLHNFHFCMNFQILENSINSKLTIKSLSNTEENKEKTTQEREKKGDN